MTGPYIRERFSIITYALRIAWELITTMRSMRRVRMPAITIFGSSSIDQKNKYAQQAFTFAQKVVAHDISVLTGGGPGIMEAANCGAMQKKEQQKDMVSSLGIGVTYVDTQYENPCVPVIRVSYFFLRKWLLIRYASAFVIFPGGVGTVDELFELLNCMKHHKVPKLPVILIGVDYWKPLIDWLQARAYAQGFVSAYQINLITVTDDLDEAFATIRDVCEQYHQYIKK